ncbi:MAG: hypothetical protein JW839_16300 [Candidatus Lokiarchaeota archaeon]|nr:hypothetical protein [Candidatus Lokiarchaeota archaeon]
MAFEEMLKTSALSLFKAIEADVKTCLEKDLDTDAELNKKKDLTKNFTAIVDFLVKLKAPGGLEAEIKDILKMIGEWDVYAYWFKEMKDLVGKVNKFMSDFTSFAEGAGLIPKAQKPAEKAPASPPERPGLAPPVKPTSPAMLKPMVLGGSQQKPTPPSMPAVPLAAKPSAGPEAASVPSTESKGRTVPLLKPVFKIPPVKYPAQPVSSPSPVPAPKSTEATSIDESSSPVPLKALVEEKKLEIHVKPVKLIKPILAVQPASPEVETPPEKAEPTARLAVPTVATKESVPAAKAAARPSPRPSGADKPLLVPKPIKIRVPDLENIDLGDDLVAGTQGTGPAGANPQETPGEQELFSEMGVIEGSIPVKARPSRVVKPIPVKIQLTKAADTDPNDEIVESVVERVSQRMGSQKARPQKAPDVTKAGATPEDEYITPMEISPEDIEEWTLGEDAKAAVPAPRPRSGPARKKDVVEMLDEAESWDDEQISSILDEAMDGGAAAQAQGGAKGGKAAGPVTFKAAARDAEPGGQDAGGGASIGVMDQEPKRTRLQEIKRVEPAVEPEPVDSMSLFMGGLGSKRGDRKASPTPAGLSLFRPGGAGEEASSTAPAGGSTRPATRQQRPAAPLGSEVDVEALPDTKDGLYQALIALEGKRYAIERARKDLRTDLDKGIVKPPAYEQKLGELKAEMDKIADKIKEIREKIKRFK